MVRPREYDETEVLDQALCVFWRRGYDGTSITDLVGATGIQRQSLYNAFTDKPGLFRAVLARYAARVKDNLAPLDRTNVGLPALRRYIESVLELQQREGFGVCLLVKTAFGPEAVHPEVRHLVETGAGLVRARFARVIEGAIERGEIASTISPEASAALLYAVLNGLSALIRTGGARAHVATILSRTFESIGRHEAAPLRTRRAKPVSA